MKTGSNQAPNSAAATGGHCRRIIEDRKSTRLNSSHDQISYAVFCLKKKKKRNIHRLRLDHNAHILLSSDPSRHHHDDTHLYHAALNGNTGIAVDRTRALTTRTCLDA